MPTDQNFSDKQGHRASPPQQSRTPTWIGAGLSLSIHALALWLLIGRAPLPDTAPPVAEEGRITVSLAPLAAPPPAPALPQPKPAPPKAAKPAKPAASRPPAPIIERAPTSIAPVTPPVTVPDTAPDPAPPAIAEPGDMSTQIDAARKRRAQARALAGLPALAPELSSEDQARQDNRVALANIARSLKRPSAENEANAGGVFQIRRVGHRDAEVFFQGWSANVQRERTRLIEVELGAEVDIQTAVVKKMIEIIREEKKTDFVWSSQRLGRQLTLSARPQDGRELLQFLMREFFPDYVPGA